MTSTFQSYSSKSTAIRGFTRYFSDFDIDATPYTIEVDGKWGFYPAEVVTKDEIEKVAADCGEADAPYHLAAPEHLERNHMLNEEESHDQQPVEEEPATSSAATREKAQPVEGVTAEDLGRLRVVSCRPRKALSKAAGISSLPTLVLGERTPWPRWWKTASLFTPPAPNTSGGSQPA